MSPLTGHTRKFDIVVPDNLEFCDDYCGYWAKSLGDGWGNASILGGQFYSPSQILLSEQQTRRFFALARSEVWRINKQRQKTAVLLTLAAAKEVTLIHKYHQLLAIDDILDSASQLTLEKKALATLENLSIQEQEIGVGVEIPYHFSEYPGRPRWAPGQPPMEVGITHGCTDTEAPMVYQALMKGLIEIPQPSSKTQETRVFITPEGYAKVDQLRSGSQTQFKQAFLICRFTDEIDAIYDGVYKVVGDELSCFIKRIKDIPHVDKIDDRICEEIRRATIVVVDLTDENFNVAFEAGFALALDKPIVWVKRKETGRIRLPFDIYTHNCLEWDADNLEQFRQDLKFRLLAALQKSASKK